MRQASSESRHGATACTILSASSSMKMSEPMKMLAAGEEGRREGGQAAQSAALVRPPAVGPLEQQRTRQRRSDPTAAVLVLHRGDHTRAQSCSAAPNTTHGSTVGRRTGGHVLLEVGKVLGIAQLLQQVAHQLHAHLWSKCSRSVTASSRSAGHAACWARGPPCCLHAICSGLHRLLPHTCRPQQRWPPRQPAPASHIG